MCPFDVHRCFGRPIRLGVAGWRRIRAGVVRAAGLIAVEEAWRIGQTKCDVKLGQIAAGEINRVCAADQARIVVSADDGDGLARAVADDRTIENRVDPVSLRDLRGV